MNAEDIDNMQAGREMDAAVHELFHGSLTNRGKQVLADKAIEDIESHEPECHCDYAAYDFEGFTCDNCRLKEQGNDT